ncbi:glycosyl transferase [Holotrichia oblita]|uniref:Glycosyl transferase n=1 Tax=Holotrichia oblita TaxID=644536 RepID=A0ACB9T7V5_HOLOL|nr:glycosyl transferase [Holotrichia oblita]
MITELDYLTLIYYFSAFAASVFLSACIFLIATSSPHPLVYRNSKEKYFVAANGVHICCPSISENASLDLSVVIPAYNEEERLPVMLDECIDFLEDNVQSNGLTYEIIVVSDGSKDKTVEVAQKYISKLGLEKMRVLDLITNRGKGGAVRLGIQSTRGRLILFADADGATKFSDYNKVEKGLFNLLETDDRSMAEKKLAISIGSRAHLQDEAIASRSFFRTILMYGFHFLVWFFAVRGIRDTQCGFKLLTRKAAKICFDNLHVERWAFDVEMLYIAQTLKIPIAEVAVNWTEIDGSKVTPVWSWVQMGKDLGLIWLRYLIGAWKIKEVKEE